MPVHVICMSDPERVEIEPPVLPALAPGATVLGGGTVLCKLDSDKTRYDPTGAYYETIVIPANWVAEKLLGLYGLELKGYVEPMIPGLPPAQTAKVEFQLSNDGGVTWLIWQNLPSAWVPAVGPLAGVFNDEDTVDRWLPQFPFISPRQLQFKLKMTPGANGLQRPVVQGIFVYNEHKIDLEEDVTRSMKRYLDSIIEIPMTYTAELAAPSNTVTVEQDVGLDVTIKEPIFVYNLTTDPGRNINLFSSLGGPNNRTIIMVGPQVGQVEIQFVGVPDVFIGAEEFFQVSKIPSIVVSMTKAEQYLDVRHRIPETERSLARLQGRLQFPRIYYKIDMTVRVQSSLKRAALQMADSVGRVLDQGQTFYSVSNGETYCVYQQISQTPEDRLGQGLYVGAVNLLVVGKVWLEGEKVPPNIPMVTEVDTWVGGQNTCNLLLPSYLRRVYREKDRIV